MPPQLSGTPSCRLLYVYRMSLAAKKEEDNSYEVGFIPPSAYFRLIGRPTPMRLKDRARALHQWTVGMASNLCSSTF